MNFYERALALQSETVAHRRFLHKHAEVGLSMPVAVKYVTEQLRAIGLEPQTCGHGVVATIGSGNSCILLRADMDALPMKEESGESFACSENAAHTCGHDFHAAMLLTAAKLLQEQRSALKGTVKLMFQPGEEILQGAADMIHHGVLENPTVDVAMGLHVAAGKLPIGLYMYNENGPMMNSADNFSLTFQGRGGHAAYPKNTVNPIPIAAQFCLAAISHVEETSKSAFVSFGQIHSGTAVNIIPNSATIEGTLRTADPICRRKLLEELAQIATQTAQAHGGGSCFTRLSGTPPLICNTELTKEMADCIRQLAIPNIQPHSGITATASEDFAEVAQAVPSTFFYLSAGFMDDRGQFPAHHPKVRFNEDVLPIGAACYAHCATTWLQNHA